MKLLWSGIASPLVYIVTDVVAAWLYPGFSYTDQAVSELFAIGAPTSELVVAGFTLSSVLALAFAVGVWSSAGHRRARRVTAVLLGCAALDALVLWNACPMHMRGVPPTMTDTMHLVLATNPFVLASIVCAAIALGGWFRAFTIATIAVILVLAAYGFSYAPAVAANGPTPWMGLAERLGQYGQGVWQMVFATVLLMEGSAPGAARRQTFDAPSPVS